MVAKYSAPEDRQLVPGTAVTPSIDPGPYLCHYSGERVTLSTQSEGIDPFGIVTRVKGQKRSEAVLFSSPADQDLADRLHAIRGLPLPQGIQGVEEALLDLATNGLMGYLRPRFAGYLPLSSLLCLPPHELDRPLRISSARSFVVMVAPLHEIEVHLGKGMANFELLGVKLRRGLVHEMVRFSNLDLSFGAMRLRTGTYFQLTHPDSTGEWRWTEERRALTQALSRILTGKDRFDPMDKALDLPPAVRTLFLRGFSSTAPPPDIAEWIGPLNDWVRSLKLSPWDRALSAAWATLRTLYLWGKRWREARQGTTQQGATATPVDARLAYYKGALVASALGFAGALLALRPSMPITVPVVEVPTPLPPTLQLDLTPPALPPTPRVTLPSLPALDVPVKSPSSLKTPTVKRKEP